MLTRRNALSLAATLAALPFAAIAEASAPDGELPPLPTPDMPPDQIVAGLVAWLGGPEAAIGTLAASVQDEIDENLDDRDDAKRVVPLIEAIEDRPDRERGFDSGAHGRQIRAAIVRYGYDKLPVPPPPVY